MEPQPDHVQEPVRRSQWEVIVITFAAAVGVAVTALWLGCLMGTIWSRLHKKNPGRPCLIVIAIYPVVAVCIWTVLAVALCYQNLTVLSRILVIVRRMMLANGNDDAGGQRMVQPPMQPPQAPVIPSSSSPSEGGVRAGGNVASAAGLQVGGESHQQRSEREREVEMSGGEAAADLQVGEESHHQRSEREREVELSGEAAADLQLGEESHQQRSTERERDVEMSGEAVSDG